MNKPEIVENIAAKAGVSKADAEKCLGAFQDVVSEALAAKEEVKLVGFGKFYARDYKAKTIKNYLGTGKTKEVPAGVTPKFSAGKTLKEAVNG